MKFCKECGTELEEGVQFCKECGTPVGEQIHEAISSQPIEATHAPVRERSKAAKTPMTKKTKMTLIATGAALVILFGGYETGSYFTSKDRIINKFQTALVNNDAKALASVLSSDDPKAKIDENSVKGLQAYFKKNPNEISDVVQDLKTESQLYDQSGNQMPDTSTELTSSLVNKNQIKLEKDGKILFWDRYKINASTVYLTLSTNYKNTDLYVDGQKVATAASDQYQTTVGPFLPGIHKAAADLKTRFVDLKTNQEVDSVGSGNQQSVDLTLNGQNVTIDFGNNGQSLNLNGDLFINGKDVKTNPFTHPTFGPVLTDGSMKLSVQAGMPWGKVKTDEVPITDTTVAVSLTDDATKKAIMDQIMKFMNQEMQAFTADDTSKMTTATQNGKSAVKNIADADSLNRSVYSQQYEGALESLKFEMDNNGFNTIYDSTHDTWAVNENAEALLNDSYFTQGGTPNLQNENKDYQFTMVFDPNSKQWLVDNWQPAEGWSPASADKEVRAGNPVMYSTDAAPASATSTAPDASSIPDYVQSTMDSYENELINAVNDGDFSEVSSTLASGSPLYDSQQQLVTKLFNAGTKESLVSYQITGYKDNQNGTCTITTHEQVQISYSNGKTATKDYDWVYTAQNIGGNTIELTNISAKK